MSASAWDQEGNDRRGGRELEHGPCGGARRMPDNRHLYDMIRSGDDDGFSTLEIAQELGCGTGTIYKARKEMSSDPEFDGYPHACDNPGRYVPGVRFR